MMCQLSSILLGSIAAAMPVMAQTLHQKGPYALHVKGQARNSSIDGYLNTVELAGLAQKPIQYTPLPSLPTVGSNSSFEFYFNYTGNSQSRGYEVGFLLVDPIAPEDGFPLLGRPLSLLYSAGSNVALALTGAAAALSLGFDSDDKAFVNLYFDDSTYVPNKPPVVGDGYDFYNWAVCWQFFGSVYVPILSWKTYGPYHNPTCESVDLIRVAL